MSLSLLSFLCFATITVATDSDVLRNQCDSLTDPHFFVNDSCYVVNKAKLNFTDAMASCKTLPNGHLAHPKTQSLIDKINKKFPLHQYWVGIQQIGQLPAEEPAGKWFWVKPDGTNEPAPANTVPWYPGQPTNSTEFHNCGVLDAAVIGDNNVTLFGDYKCHSNLQSICQYEPYDFKRDQCNTLEFPHFYFGGKCFELRRQKMDFDQAIDSCTSLPNGHLAWINDIDLIGNIKKYFQKFQGESMAYNINLYYIGLMQVDTAVEPDKGWEWMKTSTDHQPATEIFWNTGEPSNAGGIESCAVVADVANFYIADIHCALELYPICQYDLEECQGTQQQCGYETCKADKGLSLERNIRCAHVLDEIDETTDWNKAMDWCNGRGGRLLHIYTSKELGNINEYLTQINMDHLTMIGLRKVGPIEGNLTGYNMRWMKNKTEDIGIEQSYQYVGLRWTPWVQSDLTAYGTHFSCTPSNSCYGWGSLFGNISLTINPIAIPHIPFCEYINPATVKKVCFTSYMGKRMPAPVYQTFNTQNNIICAKVCSRQPHCQGFNMIGQIPNAVCHLLAIQLYDTPTQTLIDDSDSMYFARDE